MKKFIFSASVFAIMALVPAVLVGYLHNQPTADSSPATELVSDVPTGHENSSILGLVKSF
jgi:hypothetical protein